MSEETPRQTAERLAAEKYRRNKYSSAVQLRERAAFVDGYLARDTEAEKEWEDHHGHTGA